jgi:hypothetical protein
LCFSVKKNFFLISSFTLSFLSFVFNKNKKTDTLQRIVFFLSNSLMVRIHFLRWLNGMSEVRTLTPTYNNALFLWAGLCSLDTTQRANFNDRRHFIIWKDRNRRHFHNKMEQFSSLLKKVKLQAYWWLKLYYALFDFEYTVWRLSHLLCFQVVT